MFLNKETRTNQNMNIMPFKNKYTLYIFMQFWFQRFHTIDFGSK